LFLIIFALGVISGKILRDFIRYNQTSKYSDNIARMRHQAIQKAIRANKQDYKFTVGYKPVLNK
jgi:hypothetical protein